MQIACNQASNQPLQQGSLEAEDPQNVSMLQLWLKNVPKQAVYNHSQAILDKLIIPAFARRDIIIRRPVEQDAERVRKKLLSMEHIEEKLFKNNGVADSLFSLVIAAPNTKKTAYKIYGVIKYEFYSKFCYVSLLHIHPKRRRLKYASLLLNAVMIDAEHAKKTIRLSSTLEGIPLYLAFNFVPCSIYDDAMKLKRWHQLSFSQKKLMLEEQMLPELAFNLENFTSASANLANALEFDSKN